MKIIKLSQYDDKPIYINVEHISTIVQNDTYKCNTTICFSHKDNYANVKETIDEVINKIYEAKDI